MVQKHQKKREGKKEKREKSPAVKELYLLERLYEAIRNDKKRGKPSSIGRELFLMEKLYEAMVNDKKRNIRLNQN